MKSVRSRSLAVVAGTAAVAASVLSAVPAQALTPRPIVVTDDDAEEDDDDISCTQVAALDRAVRVLRVKADRATRIERAARRVMLAASHEGSTAEQRVANAQYASAHRVAVATRRAAVAARQRAGIAHARNAACPAPPPVTPPTPPVTPPTPPGPPPTSLAAPTNVRAGSATSLSSGAFRLRWTAVPGATGYEVSRSGTVLGATATTSFRPATTALNARASYTVVATYGNLRSKASTPVSAGRFVGDQGRDGIYGFITVSLAVTGQRVTGCWASYPTSGDSGPINTVAMPTLCTEAIAAQSVTIASVSGATYSSPAFKSSLQSALTRAGI